MKSYAAIKMSCKWSESYLINIDTVFKNCFYFLNWTTLNLLDCDDNCIVIIKWLQIATILTVKTTYFF